ncbi:DUF3866 family protein [Bacillus suaedae]|uniref:DUF3866 family protein n=1 Tax=Halalkalibacter suaedae TaxID=2822140 RepID=A0A941AMZ7_9BACI|nr:DUF3866 family protein [Bacillus suaedae]MBP3951085.1 DUF3866 family protein [Bacillus suaedae]
MYTELVMTVIDILYEDEEIQKLETDKGSKRALLYKSISMRANKLDRILVNTTATELNLGTGGWDIVRAHLSEIHHSIREDDGHIMKARYTPIQHSVLAVESPESPYHDHFKKACTLEGQSVWLAELHSMVPLFFYLLHDQFPEKKCCVIFDDQAALPLQMSDQHRLLQQEEAFTSITVGQAFGGDYEATTIASALQFANDVLKSDVILISVGPGVVGTGTQYGFSGMIQAEWSHMISALNGNPIWIPRVSFADQRSRHIGISHHTLTPLCRFTFKPAHLYLPKMNDEQGNHIKRQLEEYHPFSTQHHIVFSEREVDKLVIRAIDRALLPIQTMGRKYEDDPLFFCAVAEALLAGSEQ